MFVPLQMIKLTTRANFFLFETLLKPVKNVKPTKIYQDFYSDMLAFIVICTCMSLKIYLPQYLLNLISFNKDLIRISFK